MTNISRNQGKSLRGSKKTGDNQQRTVSHSTAAEFLAAYQSTISVSERHAIALEWTDAYPDDPSAWFTLGEIDREMGDFDSSLSAYSTAYSLDKTNLPVNGRLGDLLFVVGRYGESLDHFGYILETPAPPSWAYVGAANAAERLGDSEIALEWLLAAKSGLAEPNVSLNRRIVENFWRVANDKKLVHVEAIKFCLGAITSSFSPLLVRIIETEYAELNPDATVDGLTPLEHFALYGIPEQRPISQLFDNAYLGKHAQQQGLDLSIQHCSAVFFAASNRTLLPNSWLDLAYLRKQNPRFRRATPRELLTALLDGVLDQIHPLFDSKFYQAQAQQLGMKAEGSALMHYLHTGWKQGVDPHPLFDGTYYIVDVRGSQRLGANDSPLTEFIRSHSDSAYSPSPFIDLKYLRHFLCLDGYKYVNDAHMLASAFEIDWVNIHPHVHRSVLSLIFGDNELYALQNPGKATLAQFVDLISQLRLGQIAPRSDLIAPPVDYSQSPMPRVSVVILNFNKPIYTLLSIYSACRAGQSVPLEVLVADNASHPFNVELLYRYTKQLPNVHVLAIKENRFFGEGNNIAIDQARGEYIFLLNNDAVLGPRTLDRLITSANTEAAIGAIAPVLVLPDGRLQEVGGTIFGSGQVVQRDKLVTLEDFTRIEAQTPPLQYADYASAACLLLKKTTLDKVLGFDITFDPFYYEDTDLCARLRAQGLRIAIQLDAFAMHVENASTREFLGDSWMDLVDRQRQKFANRWHGVYERLSDPEVASQSERFEAARKYEILTPREAKLGYSGKPVAWVYTPFDVRVGGGERYILSVASALSAQHEVWFLTQQRMSRARLAMTMDDLAIRPGRFHHATLEDAANWQRPSLYVVMGNEIEPPTPAYGKRNIYHIQFPFPIHHTGHYSIERIHKFDGLIVNSQFTADNVRKALATYKIADKPIHIVYPPVAIPSPQEQVAIIERKRQFTGPIKIVNIGRFVTQGHHKRQDVVMDIAEECHLLKLPARFEFYGGLGGGEENAKYFASLVERGSRVKAKVHANASRRVIENALNEATFYIHPCGMGYYPGIAPEKLEHFGIALVEAMSRGCIPITWGWGGAAELMSYNACGVELKDIRSTVKLISSITPESVLAHAKTLPSCELYSDQSFAERIKAFLNFFECDQASSAI